MSKEKEQNKDKKIQTMEQMRANYALAEVERIQTDKSKDQASRTEITNCIHGLPAMIHMNGLGQALAFYRMKGGNHAVVYDVVSRWLCDKSKPGHVFTQGQDDVLKAAATADMHHYMAAQAEAQALLAWLKKFAGAFLKKAEGPGGNP